MLDNEDEQFVTADGVLPPLFVRTCEMEKNILYDTTLPSGVSEKLFFFYMYS